MANLNINEIKKYDQVLIISKIDNQVSLFNLIEGKKTLVLLLDSNLKKKFSDLKHFKNLKISIFSWSFFDDNFYDRWVPDKKSLNFIEKNKGIVKSKILRSKLKFDFFYDKDELLISNLFFRNKYVSLNNNSSIIINPYFIN